jgi:hypothetical protein
VKDVNCTFVFSSVSVFARNMDDTGAAAVFGERERGGGECFM